MADQPRGEDVDAAAVGTTCFSCLQVIVEGQRCRRTREKGPVDYAGPRVWGFTHRQCDPAARKAAQRLWTEQSRQRQLADNLGRAAAQFTRAVAGDDVRTTMDLARAGVTTTDASVRIDDAARRHRMT